MRKKIPLPINFFSCSFDEGVYLYLALMMRTKVNKQSLPLVMRG